VRVNGLEETEHNPGVLRASYSVSKSVILQRQERAEADHGDQVHVAAAEPAVKQRAADGAETAASRKRRSISSRAMNR
jgi:hypothetical protein